MNDSRPKPLSHGNILVGAVVGITHALFVGFLLHPISGGGENFIVVAIMDWG